MRRFSVMKKESSVTRDIKLQAESIHRRLDALFKKAQSLEDMQGLATAATRIQRSQHAALLRQFQQVTLQYLLEPFTSMVFSDVFLTTLDERQQKNIYCQA